MAKGHDDLNKWVDEQIKQTMPELLEQMLRMSRSVSLDSLTQAFESGYFDAGQLQHQQVLWVEWLQTHMTFALERALDNGEATTSERLGFAPMVKTPEDEVTLVIELPVGSAAVASSNAGVIAFLDSRVDELSRYFTSAQAETINALVRQAVEAGQISSGELARALRDTMSLSPRDAEAVARQYVQNRAAGMSVTEATAIARRAEATKAMARAKLIMDQELSRAWNEGSLASVTERVQNGQIPGTVKKVWLTAQDERVCPICEPLDHEERNVDESFDGLDSPPAHIACRCVLAYRRQVGSRAA